MGIAIDEARVQAHHAKQLLDPVLSLLPLREVMDVDRLADDVAHGLARIERRVRVLKDHRHLSAQAAEALAAQVRDVVALEKDLAACRLEQTDHRAAKGRFAAP